MPLRRRGEGLTVVVAPCRTASDTCIEAGGSLLEPVAVRYAQHARVIEYGWSELEERWRNLPRPTSPTLGPVWDEFVLSTAAERGPHPLVFVARHSHASYPVACFRECKQEGADLPEARFDGGQPWTHNAGCGGCLKPLPVTAAGEPALWNAFSGPWGAQRCILGGAYCDLSAAPRGPSHQGRYTNPGGEWRRICTVFVPTREHPSASQATHGEVAMPFRASAAPSRRPSKPYGRVAHG